IMIFNTVSFTALIFTMSALEAIILTQQKSQNAQLGEKIQIHCHEDSNRYDISWYQQKPGSAPKFLLVGSTRASDLPSKFSYSDDGNDDYLNIDGMTAEDEAVYYCALLQKPPDPLKWTKRGLNPV
uniref:Ig-like domain-containing protein n=1 Tax=Denticeps clupeoides TaxID=299321 RepID=A0AAY4CZ67_9TELE